ncbi:MAG: PEP-CTERM sorting domain-containing protein [Candidatus Hydrogenedentes bacterium]|nr:PEP-CTERM sorting domain-containing protein [Candidatus Hydrogenedentota bacterium]
MKKSGIVVSALAALAVSTLAGSAGATILTFDDLLNVGGNPIGNGQLIDQDYGDRVTGLIDATGSYGVGSEGFTPNVVVDYGVPNPAFWSTAYSDLTNVIYIPGVGQGPLEVLFTADAGYEVQLYGFDVGSWLSNSAVRTIRVYDQNNAVLFESLADVILASTHTSFDFNGPLTAESLRIEIDQTGLGGSSDNVGIDNIRFGQTSHAPIPEPATVTLMGLGALALGARARFRKV